MEQFEGHGDHWAALFSDTQEAIDRILPQVIQQGEVYRGQIGTIVDPTGEEQIVVALTYPETPMTYLALAVGNREKESYEVHSCYPFLAAGLTNTLKIGTVRPWENQIEGAVVATTAGGAELGFFDPLFYRAQAGYRAGQTVAFSLAGLAYSLRPATDSFIEITEGPMLEMEKERRRQEDPTTNVDDLTSIRIGLEGAAICYPTRYLDEWEFRVPVEKVDRFQLLDQTIHRIEVTLIRDQTTPLRVALFAGQDVLGDYVPAWGDDIEGVMWLQGQALTDVH